MPINNCMQRDYMRTLVTLSHTWTTRQHKKTMNLGDLTTLRSGQETNVKEKETKPKLQTTAPTQKPGSAESTNVNRSKKSPRLNSHIAPWLKCTLVHHRHLRTDRSSKCENMPISASTAKKKNNRKTAVMQKSNECFTNLLPINKLIKYTNQKASGMAWWHSG